MGLAWQEWLVIALIVGVQIALAAWIARDVRQRGISTAVLTLLFFFAPLAWVVAYVASRNRATPGQHSD